MSRRMGYLSDEIEDRMMTESRRRSGRTGRFVRSRMDDDGERYERRSSYDSRMDDRYDDRDRRGYDSRHGRSYRNEYQDSRRDDRDGYD